MTATVLVAKSDHVVSGMGLSHRGGSIGWVVRTVAPTTGAHISRGHLGKEIDFTRWAITSSPGIN